MPKFLTDPIPHEEGAEFLRDKPAVTRAVFDQLAPDLQARAFVITGVESLDTVARVRALTASLPLGGDYDELKEEILAELSPWLITETDAEERQKQIGAANRRAEMLLRMHGWQAYAQTQHELMEEHLDVFPYRQYLSSEDGQVRPHHEALNKKILPADHVFWHNHTPPWEFNCRCDVVVLTAEEAGEIDAAEQSKAPEDKQLMPAAQIRELEENGRIVKPGGQGFLDIRTPRERTGKGYEFRPGDNALDIDQILERFTPAEKKAFEDFAANQTLEDGRSLLEWWKDGAAPAPVPGQAPASPTPIAPPAKKSAKKRASGRPTPKGTPVSAAMTHHARSTRAQKAITDETLAIIDDVHGDGTLESMPVRWARSESGHYAPGREIKIGARGRTPRIQIAHELGHKLDREGTPDRGYASKAGVTSSIAPVLSEIKKSKAFHRLMTEPQYQRDRKYQRYQTSDIELFARAYAQFIAEESGDQNMLAELDLRRSGTIGYFVDSQWTPEDFKPIRREMRKSFARLGWTNPATK